MTWAITHHAHSQKSEDQFEKNENHSDEITLKSLLWEWTLLSEWVYWEQL